MVEILNFMRLSMGSQWSDLKASVDFIAEFCRTTAAKVFWMR
jgi:hypothetical protein